jgi:hypothetical protein
LKKKKLTNKELSGAIEGLSNNDLLLRKENLEMRQMFSLYLQYRNEAFNEDSEGFNEFVKAKVKEFEQQRSENKEGA